MARSNTHLLPRDLLLIWICFALLSAGSFALEPTSIPTLEPSLSPTTLPTPVPTSFPSLPCEHSDGSSSSTTLVGDAWTAVAAGQSLGTVTAALNYRLHFDLYVDGAPTGTPSLVPTTAPSSAPTTAPSSAPTTAPTGQPTTTFLPTHSYCYPDCVEWDSPAYDLQSDDTTFEDVIFCSVPTTNPPIFSRCCLLPSFALALHLQQDYDAAGALCGSVDFTMDGQSGTANECASDTCSGDPMTSSCSSISSNSVDTSSMTWTFTGSVATGTSSCCGANSCTAGRFKTAAFDFTSASGHTGMQWSWYATGGSDWYEAIVAVSPVFYIIITNMFRFLHL